MFSPPHLPPSLSLSPPESPEKADPWAPVDPWKKDYIPKPLKVKKTTILPPALRKGYDPWASENLPPISQYIASEVLGGQQNNQPFLKEIPPAWHDLAIEEWERRRELDRELKRCMKEPQTTVRERGNPFAEEEEEGEVFSGGEVGEEQDEDYVEDVGVDDGVEDFDLPNPHLGGGVGNFFIENAEEVEGSREDCNAPLTYEEMVARKVDEFVANSQVSSRNFLYSTSLHFRSFFSNKLAL